MIIQIHLTDSQLSEYFKMIGYETQMVDITEWRSEYHNRSEPHLVEQLHVILSDGSKKPAKEFFEKLIDETIINLLKNNKNGRN